MNTLKAFTVSIQGRGRLLGIVVAEGMRAYPKSTWYDYSKAMRQAITQEHQIATSGRMRLSDVASVRRAVANQKSPRMTDIALEFSVIGDVDRVKIVAGKKTRTFVHNERTVTQRDPFLSMANQIVHTVGQMA